MKKILTLLAVAMIAANLSGCCCRRLCPWLDRGAYCGTSTPLFAPLAATVPSVMPSYQPAYQPAYQYAAPLAATNACCAPAPTCATWDPCQGQVNYGYPQAMPTAGYAAPCCTTATVEPGCAYMDPTMMGLGYGPVITSGCDTCGTSYSGGVVTSPVPQQIVPVNPGPSSAEPQ
jgi:hypothetical protein